MTITTPIDVEAPSKKDEPNNLIEAEPAILVTPAEPNYANPNNKVGCGDCNLPPDFDANKLTCRSFQRGFRSFKSRNAIYCCLAVNGLCAVVACNAFFSVVAVNSFLSLGSVNSILSVGSLNSILAVGCEGEIMKVCL